MLLRYQFVWSSKVTKFTNHWQRTAAPAITTQSLRTYTNKGDKNGGYMSYSSDRDNESGGFQRGSPYSGNGGQGNYKS